jgi:hypothetical protein
MAVHPETFLFVRLHALRAGQQNPRHDVGFEIIFNDPTAASLPDALQNRVARSLGQASLLLIIKL